METHRWSRAGEQNQRAEVGGALVAKRAGGIEERADAVGLDGGADERGAPCSASRCSLLGLEELLAGVGLLGAAVGVAEDRAEDGERGGVVEDGAERDGRWLDGG